MLKDILEENVRRNRALRQPYNPIKGIGCLWPRKLVDAGRWDEGAVWLPASMLADPEYNIGLSKLQYRELRYRHDFEYWCATCIKIHNKSTRRTEPFILNRAQRRLFAVMERQRLAGKPVRVILLKARQWGGSTLTQIYMAWWQLILYENCNSVICSHLKDTSAAIRAMYSKLLENYSTPPMKLKPFEGSRNVCILPLRGNKLAVASIESQDAIRGFDFAMAHLSEVAFWRSTDRRSPDDFVRAIGGSILYAPETLIVMESTANGVGNYFHREWLRSVEGKGDKEPVFVAWHESELYELPVTDYKALWDSLDLYERRLWEKGCTLEQINWYHNKRREYPTHRQMMAEFPSDATEAFTHSESAVFAPEHVERLRKDVTDPVAVGDLHAAATTGPGALADIRFVPDSTGALRIWKFPDEYCVREQRYVVGVDIGGVSSGSDWSVITVMDCGVVPGAIPEVVASWRGHVDHDILAWKCVTMALWYHKALLVIESNTLEHENTDGDPSGFILNRIADNYTNLYYRTDAAGRQRLPGMHINRSTKTWLITLLIAAVREGSYIERDKLACDELEQYERKDNGSFSARDGCHDDILMTRALILGALPARSLTPMHVVRSYYRRDGHRYVRAIEKSAVYGRYRIGK